MAVIVSPFVCGTLGQLVGWHWGFGAAGVGMLLGLLIYLKGRYALPKEKTRKDSQKLLRPPMTARDKKAVVLLVLLIPALALSLVGNQEIFNAYLVWAEKNFQLVFFGHAMPITWMLSVDAFVTTALIAGSVLFWRWYGKHRPEPNEITKIAIGVFIAALAPPCWRWRLWWWPPPAIPCRSPGRSPFMSSMIWASPTYCRWAWRFIPAPRPRGSKA